MNQTDIAHLVDRIRWGRPTILLGTLPPLPRAVATIRVRCDSPGTLGPLDRARDRIERLLDGDVPFQGESARGRALEAAGPRSVEERFATACNRLAARAPGSVALVLEGIDGADAATHKALAQLLSGARTLLLPLILVVRQEPRGSFLEVVAAIAHSGEEKMQNARPDSVHVSQAHPPSVKAKSDDRLDGLDRQALRVLRAASVVGPTFEPVLVGRMLGLSTPEVLEALQRALDLGVPIEDDASEHFEIPKDLADNLAASVLPSLRRHWHMLLGGLLGETAYAPDPLRSAEHLDAAGDRERALARRLEAITMLVRSGDIERAAEQLGSVSEEIMTLPRSSLTAGLQARATLERARLRWLGGGLDATFTLDRALETALEARDALGEMAAASLRADVASMIAGVAYDLGDTTSLERAETVLAETVVSLLGEGANVEAATLLNDQAAVQLRLGHVVRALDLLGRSLALLTSHVREAPTDVRAQADLAATHHLMARLPLHTNAKPSEGATIPTALVHAQSARATYKALGMRRDLGRVTETIARLEAKRGNTDLARDAFSTAMRIADEIADLTGLARITAGLAELLSAAGTPHDALGMLVSSIELNREKGSPIGLAFDARILDEVERSVSSMASPDPDLRAEIDRTRARLIAAVETTTS